MQMKCVFAYVESLAGTYLGSRLGWACGQVVEQIQIEGAAVCPFLWQVGRVFSFRTKQVKVIKLYSAGPCVPGADNKVHTRINF